MHVRWCVNDFETPGNTQFTYSVFCFTHLGTYEYLAPEVIQSPMYSYEADFWSLGVVVFELLVGVPPFFRMQGDTSQKSLFKRIVHDPVPFDPRYGSQPPSRQIHSRSTLCLHAASLSQLVSPLCNLLDAPVFQG